MSTFKLNVITTVVIVIVLSLFIPWLFPIIIFLSLLYGWIETLKTSPKYEEFTTTPTEEHKAHEQLHLFMYQKSRYLKTREWNTKRKRKLASANYICQKCGAADVLHVHHTAGYALIPNEPLSCLVALCEQCHTNEHLKHGYPQTYDDYVQWNHPIQGQQ